MAWLQDWIIPYLVDYGLLAIFITMTLESACVPIPSEIVVPYGGVLAAQGHVTLWAVVLVATLANVVGSSIAYAAGRYGGRVLVLRYGRYVFLSEHHLDVADDWFARRGEITVFVTRMMPGVRTFISVPAGIARMPYVRFIVYSALGALPWNLGLAYLGYLFGENWDHLQESFHKWNRYFYVALVLAVVAVIVWKWRDIRRKRARRGERSR
jgi:membrane protein DedA with SNARE-associated domain